MASNAQFHQDAFQAAETGIDISIAKDGAHILRSTKDSYERWTLTPFTSLELESESFYELRLLSFRLRAFLGSIFPLCFLVFPC